MFCATKRRAIQHFSANSARLTGAMMTLSQEEMFYLATGLLDVNSWTSSHTINEHSSRTVPKYTGERAAFLVFFWTHMATSFHSSCAPDQKKIYRRRVVVVINRASPVTSRMQNRLSLSLSLAGHSSVSLFVSSFSHCCCCLLFSSAIVSNGSGRRARAC